MTKHHLVAIDYYGTDMGLQEIADKHGYKSVDGVLYAAKTMDIAIKNAPANEDKVIIVVDREDAPKAEYVLRGNGIKHHTPKKFELTEYYESKFDK